MLLDENVDRRLKHFFATDLEISTVSEEGWSGLTNGKLLKEASAHFDVLVTMDSELFFMRRTQGLFDYTIYISKFDGVNWSFPTVAPFSGVNRDDAPYLQPNGEYLYFDSARPAQGLASNSINLWRTRRTEKGWSEPELLRSPSESPNQSSTAGADEFGPAIDEKGNLYFYSFRSPYREGARYVAQAPQFDQIKRDRNLPDPSYPTFVSYLYISPDSKTALIEGRDPNGRERDLFYACQRVDGSWSQALSLDAVNTPAMESDGGLSTDGKILVFSSTRASNNTSAGDSNLYWMSTNELPIPCE